MFNFSLCDLTVPNQYGFRPGSNTSDCLVDLIEEITTSIDQLEFGITIFLDLAMLSFLLNWLLMVPTTRNACDLNLILLPPQGFGPEAKTRGVIL